MEAPTIMCNFADMNNFDYTSVPGDLLYCDRRHLDDFGVDDKKSLNYLIEKAFYKLYYTYPDYEDFARNAFNTAYYICTIALADSHPQRKFGAYLSIIGEQMHHREDKIGVVLSIILIQINAHKWNGIHREMGNLALCIFYEIENNHKDIHYSFYEQVNHNYDEREAYTIVPPNSEFKPREITMGVLRRTSRGAKGSLTFAPQPEDLLPLCGTDLQSRQHHRQAGRRREMANSSGWQ